MIKSDRGMRQFVRLGWRPSLTVTLSGGFLFSSCQSVVWDATVQGTKDYVLGLLDPSVVLAGLLGEDEGLAAPAG